MNLQELSQQPGVFIQWRLKCEGTTKKYLKRHKCFSYARIYTLIGDISAGEATGVLMEVLQGDKEKRNIQFQWSPTERTIFAYWQQDS